jgi:hypothetical protein
MLRVQAGRAWDTDEDSALLNSEESRKAGKIPGHLFPAFLLSSEERRQ